MWRVSRTFSQRLPCLCNRPTGPLCARCTSGSAKDTPPAAAKKADAPNLKQDVPPPPPKSGGGIFWKLLGLTVAGAGGVVGYAWYDADIKKTIEDKVPYTKDAFSYVFPYLPNSPGSQPTQSAKPKPAISQGPIVTDLEALKKESLMRKKEPTPEVKASETKTESVKPTAAEIKAKEREEKRKREEAVKQREKEEAERRRREQQAEEAAENAALEVILMDSLGDLERAVQAAVEAESLAATTTRTHTKLLREAMDNKSEESQWQTATEAFTAKSEALSQAEAATDDARLNMEKVRTALSDGKAHQMTRRNKAIVSTEEVVNRLNYDLKDAIAQNARAQSEAKVMAEYRDLVKKGREQFRKELESLTPEVKTSKRGGKLSEEELNSLIAHAHRRIEQLQRQLAESQAMETLRLQGALDRQQEEDEGLSRARVAQEQERLRADFAIEKTKWDAEARLRFEDELRRHLSRQAAAHSDHLAQVLKVQQKELELHFEDVLQERVQQEQDAFQRDVAGWIARLKGIEAAVDGRAEMEKIGRKAQELWLACQMLQTVVREGATPPAEGEAGEAGAGGYEDRMKPLLDELMAVLDAGNSHPFVNAVLSTVPDSAVKRGVWTEEDLKGRFRKVRRVCRRVAMVDEAGASLAKYFLSYVQSLFVMTSSKVLADGDQVQPESLDTFVLLDNAHYSLERGDLEQALRYMNQLRGEPRKVAADWITEARLLLETKQAADALLAHASANGLGALF